MMQHPLVCGVKAVQSYSYHIAATLFNLKYKHTFNISVKLCTLIRTDRKTNAYKTWYEKLGINI